MHYVISLIKHSFFKLKAMGVKRIYPSSHGLFDEFHNLYSRSLYACILMFYIEKLNINLQESRFDLLKWMCFWEYIINHMQRQSKHNKIIPLLCPDITSRGCRSMTSFIFRVAFLGFGFWGPCHIISLVQMYNTTMLRKSYGAYLNYLLC